MPNAIGFLITPALLYFLSFATTAAVLVILPPQYFYVFNAVGIAHAAVGILFSKNQLPSTKSRPIGWLILLMMVVGSFVVTYANPTFWLFWIIALHAILSDAFFENSLGDSNKNVNGIIAISRFGFCSLYYVFMVRKSLHFAEPTSALLLLCLFLMGAVTLVLEFKRSYRENSFQFWRWVIFFQLLSALAVGSWLLKIEVFDQDFFRLFHVAFWLYFPLFANYSWQERWRYTLKSTCYQFVITAAVLLVAPYVMPQNPVQFMVILVNNVNMLHIFLSLIFTKANPEFIWLNWRRLIRTSARA